MRGYNKTAGLQSPQFMVQLNVDRSKPTFYNLARSPLPQVISRSPSLGGTAAGSILSARDYSVPILNGSTATMQRHDPAATDAAHRGYRIAEERLMAIAEAGDGARGYTRFEAAVGQHPGSKRSTGQVANHSNRDRADSVNTEGLQLGGQATECR